MPVDVTDRASVIALADRVDAELGGTNVLVNNAGVIAPSPLLEPEESGWEWVIRVNVFGVLHGIQTFVPRMLASGEEGHVVNTSSLGGVIGAMYLDHNRTQGGTGQPDDPTPMKSYSVSKHTVVALTESLGSDLQGTRIGTSVLCPGHHENTGVYINSAGFRPEEYGGPDPEIRNLEFNPSRAGHEIGKEREELAAHVVHTIRERQFYIFTHPEFRGLVEHRFQQMLAGFDDAAAFSE